MQARHIQTKEVVAIKKMSYHGKGSQDVSWGKRGPPFLSEVSLLSVAGLRENDPQAVNKCPGSSSGNDKMVLSFFKTFSPLQLPSFTYTHAHTNINTHTHTHTQPEFFSSIKWNETLFFVLMNTRPHFRSFSHVKWWQRCIAYSSDGEAGAALWWSTRLVVERSQFWCPTGAVGECSLPGSAFLVNSYFSIPSSPSYRNSM